MKLQPTKQRIFKKKIYGFDIETCNNNKDFVCASIVGDNYKKVFYSKEEFIKNLKLDYRFRNCSIFATNLSFDFFGVFFKNEDENFKTLFRGSSLLSAKTYFKGNEFYPFSKYNDSTLKSFEFVDSMNYASLSVSKMGKIINFPKLEAPDCLGKYPENQSEWDAIIEYNLRDSEITYRFMKFLIPAFEILESTFKQTIASTSVSLFKNKYLKQVFYQPSEDILLDQFEAYYGGRTEAFERGYIKDYYYYDFNSLYPSVMLDFEFPNPNTLRTTKKNTLEYINNFHGISKVDIYCPYMHKPLLPYRREDGRLLFPIGNFTGWYSHIELRKAIELGYTIKKVYKTHYFKEMIRPFKEYVDDLYKLRLSYKEQKSIMEYVVKIVMNSLYGKFCQKFKNKDNWVHIDTLTIKQTHLIKERKGNYVRLVCDTKPSNFCVPIWGVYITSYARLKLYDVLVKYDAVYCDTDSLITKHVIPCSNELGALKLEMKVDEGIIVRPKFYALVSGKDEYVKIKGLGKRLNYLEFCGLLAKQEITYNKFTKFKESLRRDLIPNEIIKITKHFGLEDSKRDWLKEFDMDSLVPSYPLNCDNESILSEKELKQFKRYEANISTYEDELIASDLFDRNMVGNDISYKEFLDNEKWFDVNE